MNSTCPICKNIMNIQMERYPKMICCDCNNTDIKDSEGNNVTFENESMYGGFVSLHIIDNNVVEKKEHVCYVKGIKCFADEARLGGIIIQTSY